MGFIEIHDVNKYSEEFQFRQ